MKTGVELINMFFPIKDEAKIIYYRLNFSTNIVDNYSHFSGKPCCTPNIIAIKMFVFYGNTVELILIYQNLYHIIN